MDSKGHLHGFQMDTKSLPAMGQEDLLICTTTTTTKWIAICPCPKSLSKADFKVMNSLSEGDFKGNAVPKGNPLLLANFIVRLNNKEEQNSPIWRITAQPGAKYEFLLHPGQVQSTERCNEPIASGLYHRLRRVEMQMCFKDFPG